jgi:L-alanine-DL-glutamate epimerase-like enolase superfamily enzyme
VSDALAIPVAAGEQDSSLWRFQWMIDNKVMDVVQPDVNYNGGLVRTARVSRMARKAGMLMAPHNTQTGAASVNILLFASTTPNIGAFMEYPWRAPERPASWYSPQFLVRNGVLKVPTGPGLGLEIDPEYLKKAELVKL